MTTRTHKGHRSKGMMLIALLLVGSAAWCQDANAQQRRARTLRHDPAQQREGELPWVEVALPAQGTPARELHDIRILNVNGKHRKALSAIKRFMKQHGESDPLYPDIMLTKAEALIGRNQHEKAHQTLQALLDRFGGSSHTAEALRLDMVIAESFLSGTKRKVWGMPFFSGVDLAYEILDTISVDYPGNRYAEIAIKTKADALFRKGEHALAELVYDRLLREYPRGRYAQFALRRSAESSMASFGGIEYDDSTLIDAEERYAEYMLRFPQRARREGVPAILEAVRESRAGQQVSVAAYYERTGHWESAVYYYRSVGEKWPDTVAATKAFSRLELLGASDASGLPSAP